MNTEIRQTGIFILCNLNIYCSFKLKALSGNFFFVKKVFFRIFQK